MRKLLFACFILLLSLIAKAQHNSDYIQYMFNGLLINPAYAGSHEALNLTALYRKQWTGIGGAPVTMSFGAHSALKNKKLNLGFILENDRFGLFDHTRAQLVYAYRFRLLKGLLALGAQFGIDAYSINWNAVQIRDLGDPNFTGFSGRNIYPAAGAGAYFHNPHFYLGLSLPSLPVTRSGSSAPLMFNTGGVITLSEAFKLKPALLIKYIAHSPATINLSATFYYKEVIGLGLGYTHLNSVFSFFDIRVNEQLRFGYGYAHSLSLLNAYTTGSHELMLRYLFRYKINAVSPRYF